MPEMQDNSVFVNSEDNYNKPIRPIVAPVGLLEEFGQIWSWTHNNDAADSTANIGGVPLYGKTGEGSNIQPYFTCYIWLRIE